jgi:hypothetical protein
MKCVSRLAASGFAVLFCALLTSRPAAAAVTVYDNLGNGNNGFFGIGPNAWFAERFKSDATNLKITDVTIRLAATTPGPYSLDLYSDVAGVPGAPLANLFTGNTANGDVHYSTSALTAPGTTYWIVASVPTGAVINSGWGTTSTLSGTGTGFFSLVAMSANQGASWTTRGDVAQQMRILADVPEPATAALVGIAAALSTLARRRPERPTA